MGAKRKSYTPKYRQEAAHLVIDTGRTIVEVAREIGVGEQLLGRWVAIERSRIDDPPAETNGKITKIGKTCSNIWLNDRHWHRSKKCQQQQQQREVLLAQPKILKSSVSVSLSLLFLLLLDCRR